MRVSLLFTLWVIAISGLQAQCPSPPQALFDFAYLNDSTVLLFNRSDARADHQWDIDGALLLEDYGTSAVMDIPAGDTAQVCLKVWEGPDCADTSCVTVFPNSTDEMCYRDDCVWPGDANGDGKANVYDLLNIGLGFGQTGVERTIHAYPGDPTAWAPHPSADWDKWLGAVNYKHLDCDGNGTIDANDMEAIRRNYRNDPFVQSVSGENAPPLFLAFDSDIEVVERAGKAHIEIAADLRLGSDSRAFQRLHGLALQLEFPDSEVQPDSVIFNPSSKVDSSSFLWLDHNTPAVDDGLLRYDLGITRTDGSSLIEEGALGKVRFIVIADIIGGITEEPAGPLEVQIKGVRMLDTEGDPLDYYLPHPSTKFNFREAIATNTDNPATPAKDIRLYPNPARDAITLETNGGSIQSINLFNAIGQLQRTLRPAGAGAYRISVANLQPGHYFVQLRTNRGTVVKRFFVE